MTIVFRGDHVVLFWTSSEKSSSFKFSSWKSSGRRPKLGQRHNAQWRWAVGKCQRIREKRTISKYSKTSRTSKRSEGFLNDFRWIFFVSESENSTKRIHPFFDNCRSPHKEKKGSSTNEDFHEISFVDFSEDPDATKSTSEEISRLKAEISQIIGSSSKKRSANEKSDDEEIVEVGRPSIGVVRQPTKRLPKSKPDFHSFLPKNRKDFLFAFRLKLFFVVRSISESVTERVKTLNHNFRVAGRDPNSLTDGFIRAREQLKQREALLRKEKQNATKRKDFSSNETPSWTRTFFSSFQRQKKATKQRKREKSNQPIPNRRRKAKRWFDSMPREKTSSRMFSLLFDSFRDPRTLSRNSFKKRQKVLIECWSPSPARWAQTPWHIRYRWRIPVRAAVWTSFHRPSTFSRNRRTRKASKKGKSWTSRITWLSFSDGRSRWSTKTVFSTRSMNFSLFELFSSPSDLEKNVLFKEFLGEIENPTPVLELYESFGEYEEITLPWLLEETFEEIRRSVKMREHKLWKSEFSSVVTQVRCFRSGLFELKSQILYKRGIPNDQRPDFLCEEDLLVVTLENLQQKKVFGLIQSGERITDKHRLHKTFGRKKTLNQSRKHFHRRSFLFSRSSRRQSSTGHLALSRAQYSNIRRDNENSRRIENQNSSFYLRKNFRLFENGFFSGRCFFDFDFTSFQSVGVDEILSSVWTSTQSVDRRSRFPSENSNRRSSRREIFPSSFVNVELLSLQENLSFRLTMIRSVKWSVKLCPWFWRRRTMIREESTCVKDLREPVRI